MNAYNALGYDDGQKYNFNFFTDSFFLNESKTGPEKICPSYVINFLQPDSGDLF